MYSEIATLEVNEGVSVSHNASLNHFWFKDSTRIRALCAEQDSGVCSPNPQTRIQLWKNMHLHTLTPTLYSKICIVLSASYYEPADMFNECLDTKAAVV